MEIVLLIAKWVGAALVGAGATFAGIYLKHFLGKTKAEAEVILNWEDIHEKRDKKLLAEIERLEKKIDNFMKEINLMEKSHQKEIAKWESSTDKHLLTIKQREEVIIRQEKEIEEKDLIILELKKSIV